MTSIAGASAGVLLLLATACTADSEQSPSTRAREQAPPGTTAANDTGEPQRVCELTRRLERAGRDVFSKLGRDATRAEYQAAEREFVLDNAATLHDLVDAFPSDIAPQAELFITAMRQRAGLVPAGTVRPSEASAAERRIRAYEREHC